MIIEDETLLLKRLSAYLTQLGAKTCTAENLAEAQTLLQETDFDFALLDVHLPDGNGLELLDQKKIPANCGVVVMTAEGGVRSAVEAMKKGAREYLVKPFDFSELPIVFERSSAVLQQLRILEHLREHELNPQARFFFGSDLGELKAKLEKIIESDFQLAENPPPVLITGETGTGKSTLARWIHFSGPRRDQQLVEVNCATLSDSLAESELFGHERGAFTDAKESRIGLFEAADNGTLFLDEIPSLTSAVQSKVLTAIEDKSFRRVGGTRTTQVNVRIIAASLHDLKQKIQEGLFREDLYYRMDLLRIHIEPLRSRQNDIVDLTNHLLRVLAQRFGKAGVRLSALGEKRLRSHDWPGNVRELTHELERSLILEGKGPLNLDGLSKSTEPDWNSESDEKDWLARGWEIPDHDFSLEDSINRFIQLALDKTNGNISASARLLNVPRDFIRYRLKKMK